MGHVALSVFDIFFGSVTTSVMTTTNRALDLAVDICMYVPTYQTLSTILCILQPFIFHFPPVRAYLAVSRGRARLMRHTTQS